MVKNVLKSRRFEIIFYALFAALTAYVPNPFTLMLLGIFTLIGVVMVWQDFSKRACPACKGVFLRGETRYPYIAHHTAVCPLCENDMPPITYDNTFR